MVLLNRKRVFCMKEITTEELLKEIEENHNNSLFEELKIALS